MTDPRKVLPPDHPLSAYRETWEFQHDAAKRNGLPEAVAREHADLYIYRLRANDAWIALCSALPDCPLRESLLKCLSELVEGEEDKHRRSVHRLYNVRSDNGRPRNKLRVYRAALRFFQNTDSTEARRDLLEIATAPLSKRQTLDAENTRKWSEAYHLALGERAQELGIGRNDVPRDAELERRITERLPQVAEGEWLAALERCLNARLRFAKWIERRDFRGESPHDLATEWRDQYLEDLFPYNNPLVGRPRKSR